jgi:hypothetical protein
MEEEVKKLLEDYENRNIKNVNDRIEGIFIYGFIIGIIASYSGLLSYFAGISTGIIFSKKYDYICTYVSESSINMFQYFNNKWLSKK